jgi:CBS domain-containing protein
MRVGELLRKKTGDVVTISPRSTIAHAVELLLEHNIGGLPVVDDNGALVGFAAERDLLRALHLDPNTDEGLPIERLMRKPAPVCDPADDVRDAMGRIPAAASGTWSWSMAPGSWACCPSVTS